MIIVLPEAAQNGDDYIENGLLKCGKCHSYKEAEVVMLGETKKMPICCMCEKKALEQKESRQVEEDKRLKLEAYHKSNSKLAIVNENATIENAESNPVLEKVKKYIDSWQEMKGNNIGLLFWGDVGTGKTYYTSCIANELKKNFNSIMADTLTSLVNQMGFEKVEETTSYIEKSDLLIIDDLGTERQSQYALEQVYHIIDTRYKAQKPLLITTNLSLTELQNPTSVEYKRIYDRVLEMCVPIRVVGDSRRKEIRKEKMEKAKELLG